MRIFLCFFENEISIESSEFSKRSKQRTKGVNNIIYGSVYLYMYIIKFW